MVVPENRKSPWLTAEPMVVAGAKALALALGLAEKWL